MAFTEVHVAPTVGIVAILVTRAGPFEQIFNQPLPGGCIRNWIKIGPRVSEEKSFENVNKHSILVTFGLSLNDPGL